MTTDILYYLKDKYMSLTRRNENKVKDLRKFMDKFLFLFSTNPYTDAHEYYYKSAVDGWYVNIHYYPSSGACSVETGTLHPDKQIIGKYQQTDSEPDVDKITEAFRRKLVAMNDGKESRYNNMKKFKSVFERVIL
jgi:hypothetical protein